MKPKTQALFDDLKATNWFSAVGTPPPEDTPEIKWITQWMDATTHMLDDLWPVINYQRGAELEKSVKSISRNKIREWKSANEELAPLARTLARQKLDEMRTNRHISRMVDEIVSYDILHALLEAEFADLIIPDFFTWKADVYLKGRLPCGVTDDGRPIIF